VRKFRGKKERERERERDLLSDFFDIRGESLDNIRDTLLTPIGRPCTYTHTHSLSDTEREKEREGKREKEKDEERKRERGRPCERV